MKETIKMCSIWKESVQWDKMTKKQKLLSVWFSLSLVVLGMSGENLLLLVMAAVNFGLSAYLTVKHVPMEDE